MTLDAINQLSDEEAKQTFQRCCASSSWVKTLTQSRPFLNRDAFFKAADRAWQGLVEADFFEAFAAHPKIGDLDSLRAQYANTKDLASNEQSGMSAATDQTLKEFTVANNLYTTQFGFIFIVCATGKTAAEMLALLQQRLANTKAVERLNAAEEQKKITHIRLAKLIGE